MDQTTGDLTDWLEIARRYLATRWGSRVAYFGFIPFLVVVALLLPPFSAWERLAYGDFTTVGRQGGMITHETGARLTVVPGSLAEPIRLRLTTVSPRELSGTANETDAASANMELPDNLHAVGPVYRVEVRGSAKPPVHVSLPVPDQVPIPALLDLFTWDSNKWQWTPFRLNGRHVTATLKRMPVALALAQQEPVKVEVAAAFPAQPELSDAALDAITTVNPVGYYVLDDGSIGGSINIEGLPAPPIGPLVLPTVSNVVEGVVRSDWVHNILIDPDLREAHVEALVELATTEGYHGLDLDYRQVDPAVRGEFAAFVADLAHRLHAEGKLLTVAVSAPTPLPDGQWDTGGYDWVALGRAADRVKVPLPREANLALGGRADDLLAFAVGQVNRSKLQLSLSGASRDTVGDQVVTLTYAEALERAGGVVAYTNPRPLMPKDFVSLDLPQLRTTGGIKWDEENQCHWFTYQDSEGQTHRVLLEDVFSLAQKISLANRYNLNGVALRDLGSSGNDERLWPFLINYRLERTPETNPSEFVVVWTVQDERGRKLSEIQRPADNPRVAVTMEAPGEYVISAAISADEGRTLSGFVGSYSLEVQAPTATPTPQPTATPTLTPTPRPTRTPAPTAVAKQPAAPPPGRVGGAFGYGIQVAMVTDTNHARILDHVKDLGFNWIKQQVEWFRFEPVKGQIDWGPLDRIVESANAYGINVLFSVVKAPRWARPPNSDFSVEGPPANPQDFADFLGAMAARYKGRVRAYEVWNEQNLWYEWGHEPLDANRYVQLLAAAYKAIKANDPNAIVVSGALTPTGVNDGVIGVDDALYLEQMYQAGLKNYCDAVGVHPSGYNNPPDARWETWSDPTAPSFKGHRSFFFRSTMEQYRNIMIKYGDGGKRLWPTEFGWASVEGLGVPPAHGYEYAADNTEAEQAAWLVQAFQMARNWGWVGPMFLWNLNFAPVAGPADEKAAFGIVRADWSPRPAYFALRDMPK